MGSFVDLTGKKYGRLTVIERDKNRNYGQTRWLCKCDCGKTTSVLAGNLKNGHTKSCGCFKAETDASHFFSNDETRKNNIRLYSIYKSMKNRCFSHKNKCYHNYGGRGISICDHWLGKNGFKNFVNWSKENGYQDGLTIDRIDYNGNYTPDNCRWVTNKDNANNKRNNRYIEYNGEIKTLSQWADYHGITQCELKRRLDYLDLPIEAALSYHGLPMTQYKGRTISIRWLAEKHKIDYKTFLKDVLVYHKTAEEIINKSKSKANS